MVPPLQNRVATPAASSFNPATDLPPATQNDSALGTLYDDNVGACRPADPKCGPSVELPAPLSQASGVPRRTISEGEAKALFKELGNLTFIDKNEQIKQVTFAYPDDGCYARAHVMAQRLALRNVQSEKVFATGSLAVPNDRGADAPAGQPGVTRWGWHVAPVISVLGNDGVVRKMVLDPSIAKGPITVDQWKAIMGGNANITYGNANAYYPGQASPAKPDAASSEAAHNATSSTMDLYAFLAPAHQLAAKVRGMLRAGDNSPEAKQKAVALIEKESYMVQAAFNMEFPVLKASLRS
jgi:hypothetical protein